MNIPRFCTSCQSQELAGFCSNPFCSNHEFLAPAAIALVVRQVGTVGGIIDERTAYVEYRTEVLAVTNRHYGGFALPGGKIEEQDGGPGRDDPIKFGCVRELREEVGLVAAPHNLRLVYKAPTTITTGRLCFAYHVAKVSGAERAVEDGGVVEWMTWEKLCEVGVFAPYYRDAFPDGVDMLKPTEFLR